MKYLSITLFLLTFAAFSALAQNDKSTRKSPPVEIKGTVVGTDISIDYSSPSAKGRELWGGLVPYDKIWRTGANEATTISFSQDVMVEGQLLKAYKYSLFTIPGKEKWVIVFNKVSNQWGAYGYNAKDDALRVEVTPEKGKIYEESLKFEILDSGLKLKWGELIVPVHLMSIASQD